jgi:hypothetical protein
LDTTGSPARFPENASLTDPCRTPKLVNTAPLHLVPNRDRQDPCILNCLTVRQEAVATATASGNGAANAVAYISGSTTTKMLWPESSIPYKFTVCSVTRYTGGTKTRILNCQSSPTQSLNWAHGHYYGRRGAAYYYGDKTSTTSAGVVDDWLVMCGTNDYAVAVPGNIILDQYAIGTASGGDGNGRLNINYYQPSDWALHSLLIWDYALGTAPEPSHTLPDPSILVTVYFDVTLSMVRSRGVCNGCLRRERDWGRRSF